MTKITGCFSKRKMTRIASSLRTPITAPERAGLLGPLYLLGEGGATTDEATTDATRTGESERQDESSGWSNKSANSLGLPPFHSFKLGAHDLLPVLS